MRDPIKWVFSMYRRLNIRPQITAAIVGAVALVSAAIITGLFGISAARVQARSQTKVSDKRVIQGGSGNLQVEGDLSVAGDLNVIMIAPKDGNSIKTEDATPVNPLKTPDMVPSVNTLKTKYIFPASTFIALSRQIREKVRNDLETIRRTSELTKVVFSVEGGSIKRRELASEMAEILESAGFGIQIRDSTAVGDRPPFKAIFNATRRDSAVAILESFGPMLRGAVVLKPVEGRNHPEELFINVYGNPVFFPDGTVIFKEPE